ncbi:MAG: outer membrane protein assembly factor BamD [Bacteroidetes bacterium]|nr:outer membrane protein assembly factor BamD [Bacteroidota bacterium]
MKRVFLAISFLFLIVACSDYSRIVKGDDYSLKFETANALYNKEDFDRCIVLYEQIYQHSPRTGEGELAYYRLAKSYFETEDYYMAAYYFDSYLSRFPFGPKVEESMFMKALCSVRNSPSYYLDQGETDKAINNIQDFINRYPDGNRVDTCNLIMDELRFKIERKDFEEVRLYSKTENYRAAVTSAEIFLSKYSKSVFLEENGYLLVMNSILLAQNSIDSKKQERIEKTMERFRNFAFQFKNSSYLTKLKTMVEKMELDQDLK